MINKFIRSSLIFSILTMVSRILGLFRDMLLAYFFGVGIVTDILFIALKIPNLFRSLLAEGGVNLVFTPIFNKYVSSGRVKRATILSSQVLAYITVTTVLLTIVVEVFIPQIASLLFTNIQQHSDQHFKLLILLIRITFPYLIFISIISIFQSILNSFKFFIIGSSMPIIFNVCTIMCILLNFIKINIIFVACGILVSGIVQLLIILQVFIYKQVISIPIVNIFRITTLTKVFLKKLIPVLFNSGIYQINMFVSIIIAASMPNGALSYLFYADRLFQLPLAIIGVGLSTVILSYLSNSQISLEECNDTKRNGILFIVILALPATSGLVLLGENIISLIFGYGKFNNTDINNTYYILSIYALSLIFNIMIKFFQSIYYANQDTSTPFYINTLSLVLNVILVISLSIKYSYIGIACAQPIVAITSFILFIIHIKYKELITLNKRFYRDLLKIIIANIVLLFIIIEFHNILSLITVVLLQKVLLLFGIIVIILIYFILLWFLRTNMMEHMFINIKKRF